MWARLLDGMLRRLVSDGALEVRLPDGTRRRYGRGDAKPVCVTLSDPATLRRVALNPDLAVGEAWMDGTLTIEGDDLHGLLELVFRNGFTCPKAAPQGLLRGIRRVLRWVEQYNPATRARRNVAHHYDLSGELYGLFLDRDRQYSCAYFPKPDTGLDEAQEAKKALIARKLLLRPGMKVLDIGCGWGGMGLTLAREHGAEVTGVTLSEEQHKLANARASEAGLDGRAAFHLRDYRDQQGVFDRIVSVGMFEHVGVPHYREYFRHLREKLAPDGVALVHTIGRSEGPGATNAWMAKYIFPGGYIPALSEASAAIEREGLMITDVEVWRLHYAETLRHWYDRFMANIDRARALYDERFCRMWRFYLVGSEMSFRHGTQVVFQFQLARRHGAVPVTRDYLMAPPAKPALELVQAAEA